MRFDHLILQNVAQSAMDDISRYKTFHLSDENKRADCLKRSAYYTKWIVKLRPIYCVRMGREESPEKVVFDENDVTLTVNEGLALNIALCTIAVEINVAQIHLMPEFMADLLYDLHYRDMSDDALMTIYGIVREAAREASPQHPILKVIKHNAESARDAACIPSSRATPNAP